jgi:hypothetical protein
MRSNVIGTSFSVYEQCKEEEEEVAYVSYEPNLTGPKQPRKIRMIIPSMDQNGQRNQKNSSDSQKRMIDIVKEGNESRQFVELVNKQPEWSAANNAFVLNFSGRVLVSSIKNFQIIHQHDMDYITLQFGKGRLH